LCTFANLLIGHDRERRGTGIGFVVAASTSFSVLILEASLGALPRGGSVMDVLVERCAGLDVHQKPVVCRGVSFWAA
jgi:hypothetical protein